MPAPAPGTTPGIRLAHPPPPPILSGRSADQRRRRVVRGTVARPRISALVELARPHATAALLVAMVVLSCLLLRGADGASGVPLAWPAAGLLPGVLLLNHAARRASLLALGGALLLLCHLLAEYDVVRSVGFTVASVLGAWLMM